MASFFSLSNNFDRKFLAPEPIGLSSGIDAHVNSAFPSRVHKIVDAPRPNTFDMDNLSHEVF